MCEQRITAIKYMSNGVALVFPERDFRVHTDEVDMRTIVFSWSGAVKQLIILFHQCNAPLGVLPNPVGKSILNDLLFLLGESGFRFVQHTLQLTLGILYHVVNPNIFEV